MWDRFVGIGGFANQPNITGNNTFISVEMVVENYTHNISLAPLKLSDYSDYEYTLQSRALDLYTLEYTEKNHNYSNTLRIGITSLIEFSEGRLTLTADRDQDGNIDIFWMSTSNLTNHSQIFYVFYSQIDTNGSVTYANNLIYHEKTHYEDIVIRQNEFIIFYVSLVVVIICAYGYSKYRKYKRSKMLDKEQDDYNIEEEGT
jgi:hypothetical protein